MKQNKKYEPEIDFKSLLKNPKRLFGWVFPYFLFIVLLLGIFYVNNLNSISENSAPVNAPVEDNVKRTIEAKKGTAMKPVNLDVIQNPSEELIANGKELYQQNCSSCHGDKGLGNGPAGAALNPPPRDLTNLEGWTNGPEFPQMYKTLEEGIAKNGMAAYEYMPPKDRIAIIQFIRTLADYPEITDDQVQEVESTYNLAKGKNTNNQIPVERAVTKVLNEKSISSKISNVIAYVDNHPSLPGADIFKKSVINKRRVLITFASVKIDQIDLNEFVEIVSTNFNEIGFSANVNLLEDTEWQSLFSYIKNVLGVVSV